MKKVKSFKLDFINKLMIKKLSITTVLVSFFYYLLGAYLVLFILNIWFDPSDPLVESLKLILPIIVGLALGYVGYKIGEKM
jgi:uncharacterized membrane protein YeaQ/YmgE (transglycosylase-associated protein family)